MDNNKETSNYWKVILYIILLLVAFIIIYFWGMKSETVTSKFVLVFSSAASIIGVVISIFEIVGVKSKTEAINESVKKAKNEISKYVNYSDINQMIHIIDEIEAHLHADKYESALLKMKELKDNAFEYQGYINEHQNKEINLVNLKEIIVKIGQDVNTLHIYVDDAGTIDKDKMFQNLEDIKDFFSKESGKIKAKNYG